MSERPADWDARIERVRGLWVQSLRRDASLADANFRLADELLALAPIGSNRAHNGCQALIREIADEVGAPPKQLEAIRYVGSRWPVDRRREGVGWSVYAELARNDRRYSILAKLEEEGGKITVERARQATGKPSMGRIGGVQQKVQRIQRDMSDPAVHAALQKEKARDRGVREALAADAEAKRRAEAEERQRLADIRAGEKAQKQRLNGRVRSPVQVIDEVRGTAMKMYLFRKEAEDGFFTRPTDQKQLVDRCKEIVEHAQAIIDLYAPATAQPKGVIDINEARAKPGRGLSAG